MAYYDGPILAILRSGPDHIALKFPSGTMSLLPTDGKYYGRPDVYEPVSNACGYILVHPAVIAGLRDLADGDLGEYL